MAGQSRDGCAASRKPGRNRPDRAPTGRLGFSSACGYRMLTSTLVICRHSAFAPLGGLPIPRCPMKMSMARTLVIETTSPFQGLPELVAFNEGLFAREGLDVQWAERDEAGIKTIDAK